MRKLLMLAIAGVLVFAGGSALAQRTTQNLRRPTPVIIQQESPDRTLIPRTTLSTMSATPATITFTANQPGTGTPVAGSSTATVKWTQTAGTYGNTWTLSVYADSTTFTGCSTVPASAAAVTCTTAAETGAGDTANCYNSGTYYTLPTTAPGQEVASGNEGYFGTMTFTITLTYHFTDSWEFIADAAGCPLTITYTVNAP